MIHGKGRNQKVCSDCEVYGLYKHGLSRSDYLEKKPVENVETPYLKPIDLSISVLIVARIPIYSFCYSLYHIQ